MLSHSYILRSSQSLQIHPSISYSYLSPLLTSLLRGSPVTGPLGLCTTTSYGPAVAVVGLTDEPRLPCIETAGCWYWWILGRCCWLCCLPISAVVEGSPASDELLWMSTSLTLVLDEAG